MNRSNLQHKESVDQEIVQSAAAGPGGASEFSKRMFDLVLSSILLVLFAPLLLIVTLLVKLDGGPVFFRHKRVGRGGVSFNCLKFRTMRVDAAEVLKEILARDPIARAEWAKDFKLRSDPRVTKVGRFLRKTSLDELAQLFNVLKGEMSLVGPRPIVSEEMGRYGAAVHYYLQCKPGITGLWQVSGRNDLSYADRVALDAEYSQNVSLAFDIAILFQTFFVVLSRKGAY